MKLYQLVSTKYFHGNSAEQACKDASSCQTLVSSCTQIFSPKDAIPTKIDQIYHFCKLLLLLPFLLYKNPIPMCCVLTLLLRTFNQFTCEIMKRIPERIINSKTKKEQMQRHDKNVNNTQEKQQQ